MQTDTTNSATAATDTTQETTDSPTLASLADFISDYRARMDAKEREQEENRRERAEENISHLRKCLEGFLSPELFAALDLYFSRSVRHPRSDLAAAYFNVDGVAWSIYLDEEWTIAGEQGYTRYPWPVNDDAVLSAIAEYPAWLAQQQERERRKAEPRRYTEITSAVPGDGFLHRGARVIVSFAAYYGEDSTAERGAIEAWDKNWLLLTDDEGQQRLINWRHVATVEPCKQHAEKPAPAQAEQPTPITLNPDMMSDEIPF